MKWEDYLDEPDGKSEPCLFFCSQLEEFPMQKKLTESNMCCLDCSTTMYNIFLLLKDVWVCSAFQLNLYFQQTQQPRSGPLFCLTAPEMAQVGRLYRTDGFLQLLSDLILHLGDDFEAIFRVLFGSMGTNHIYVWGYVQMNIYIYIYMMYDVNLCKSQIWA